MQEFVVLQTLRRISAEPRIAAYTSAALLRANVVMSDEFSDIGENLET
jgi:hypothetical protein